MNFLTPAILAVMVSVNCATDEVQTPDILFPMTPVLVEPTTDPVPLPDPVPQPKPVAEVVNKLPYNAWYIIETKEKMLVYASPNDLVTITPYDLSVSIRTFNGLFVNGSGEWDEEKTYPTQPTYKYAYRIKALKVGTVELIFNSSGATEEGTATRQTIVVSGKGPLPPPIPDPTPDVDPEPDPKPDVTPDISPTGIKVVLLYNENASRDQLNTVNSTKIVDWMNSNCSKTPQGVPIWRRWDRTSVARTGVLNETDTVQKLWAAIQPFIAQDNMIFVATDKKVHFRLMSTPEDALLFLQQVKDGK